MSSLEGNRQPGYFTTDDSAVMVDTRDRSDALPNINPDDKDKNHLGDLVWL